MTAADPLDIDIEAAVRSRLNADPILPPYKESIQRRMKQLINTKRRITGGRVGLPDFASGHEYYGMHCRDGRWIFCEWAPNATAIFLKGDFSQWRTQERFSLSRISNGGEIYLLHSGDGDKVLAFLRNDMVFVFNFHPLRSFSDYCIPAAPGSYRIILLDTDRERYGGFNRQDPSINHETATDRIHRHYLSPCLPSRTAIILEREDLPINL